MADVIVIESSDEEDTSLPAKAPIATVPSAKRKLDSPPQAKDSPAAKIPRRIQPTTISKQATLRFDGALLGDDEVGSSISPSSTPSPQTVPLHAINIQEDCLPAKTSSPVPAKAPLVKSNGQTTAAATAVELSPEFTALLETCKKIERSDEMEVILEKMKRYYGEVNPDFVGSKSFRLSLSQTVTKIEKEPALLFVHIKNIVEELKTRRKDTAVVMTNEHATVIGTGDPKKDAHLKRLNRALYQCKREIERLEQVDVDFDEENNSSYLMENRLKKRAVQIYEKICEMTGESKHARREVKMPIRFRKTKFLQFDRAIEKLVAHGFPDYADVFNTLTKFNDVFNYGLNRNEVRKIAEDAFVYVGKMLQQRRKKDLFETVIYFTGVKKDPADEDRDLKSKLSENKKVAKKIDDVIEKYVKESMMPPSPAKESGTDEPSTSSKDQHENITILSPSNTPPPPLIVDDELLPDKNDSEKPLENGEDVINNNPEATLKIINATSLQETKTEFDFDQDFDFLI